MAPTPNPLSALLAGCVGDRAQVRTDELSLRALAHDASHVLLIPRAVVAPRTADEVGRLLRGDGRRGSSADVPVGRDQPVGAGRRRRRAARRAPPLPARRGARRRCPGPRAAGGHGPARERPAGAARPQARAGPGQRGGRNDRRGRRQQLLRHGLRHGAEQLPDAGVAGRGAAVGHCGRHRGARCRRAAARAGAGAARRAARAAAAGAGQPRLGRDDHPAVRDEEHHGLRDQRPARLRHRCRSCSRTCWSAARGRSRSSPPRPSGPSRCARTPPPLCSSSTTSTPPTGRCPAWCPPAPRRSSSWTPPRCGWARGSADCPAAVAALTVDRQAALLVEYQADDLRRAVADLVGSARPSPRLRCC